MREGDLTYDDFLQRLNIQDVLIDAGYHLNRRDGLRYPSYVRLDNEGRRIRGDKFIVTQQGKCCFHAQQQKVYNIISFIKAHPQFFAEYRAGMSPDRLVNLVCNRLLNIPVTERKTRISPAQAGRATVRHDKLRPIQVQPAGPGDAEEVLSFFKSRGIDLYTQYAFHRHFCLATKHREDGAAIHQSRFSADLAQRRRARSSVSKNGDVREWTEAAATRARPRAAIRARGCGLPTCANRW